MGHRVGVCYGCYLECHLGHDLVVELFNRRKFRCDCPSLSSTIGECHLWKGESVAPQSNVLNKYNHNFDDVFCWCKRGYSADSNAILIHCLLCEDWFHPECIHQDAKFKHALDDDDNVFVCHPCLLKTPILLKYPHLLVPSSNESKDANIDKNTGSVPSSHGNSSISVSVVPSSADPSDSSSSSSCTLPKDGPSIDTHALFQIGWNHKICRCSDCKAALEASDLLFLLDDDDDTPLDPTESHLIDIESNDPSDQPPANITLAEAVRRSENKKRKRSPFYDSSDSTSPHTAVSSTNDQASSTNDQASSTNDQASSSSTPFDPLMAGIEAFSALPHHQAKSNVIRAYDVFAKQLESFFKQAADQGQILTAKDIHDFFDKLKRSRGMKK